MKSHVCEFSAVQLLRLIALPLVPVAIFAAFLHAGARLKALPPPRPTLDAERTILVHQAEAARSRNSAEILLLGDSSCLMDVSARQLGEILGRPVLSLATFSFLDLNSHGAMLREFNGVNPNQVRAVVLLMHPESLRRVTADERYAGMLAAFWEQRDHYDPSTLTGRAQGALGVDIFKGRILSRTVPSPLNGAYGRYYGFTSDLERFLNARNGSAIDPDPRPFSGSAEYRLAPALEKASRAFRTAVPPGVKFFAGITPVPERFAGADYPTKRNELLTRWGGWLQTDGLLTNLPPALPDESFVRSTHLKESAVSSYTERLGATMKALNIR